jgi:hypothetical protein
MAAHRVPCGVEREHHVSTPNVTEISLDARGRVHVDRIVFVLDCGSAYIRDHADEYLDLVVPAMQSRWSRTADRSEQGANCDGRNRADVRERHQAPVSRV